VATHEYRYELWVPPESVNRARDRIYTQLLDGEAEPRRGPDMPGSSDSPPFATFYVTMGVWGMFGTPLRRSRHLRNTDKVFADLARELEGHAYRVGRIAAVHLTVTSSWGPLRQVGDP